jgi:hypothetical protein
MGLFGRKSPRTTSNDAAPPARGQCACPEHIEDVLDLPVPLVRELPALCEAGVLAAAARALIDPRVRLPED